MENTLLITLSGNIMVHKIPLFTSPFTIVTRDQSDYLFVLLLVSIYSVTDRKAYR